MMPGSETGGFFMESSMLYLTCGIFPGVRAMAESRMNPVLPSLPLEWHPGSWADQKLKEIFPWAHQE